MGRCPNSRGCSPPRIFFSPVAMRGGGEVGVRYPSSPRPSPSHPSPSQGGLWGSFNSTHCSLNLIARRSVDQSRDPRSKRPPPQPPPCFPSFSVDPNEVIVMRILKAVKKEFSNQARAFLRGREPSPAPACAGKGFRSGKGPPRACVCARVHVRV